MSWYLVSLMTDSASEMRSSDETVGNSAVITFSTEMPSICDLSMVIFFRSSRSFTAIEFTSVVGEYRVLRI